MRELPHRAAEPEEVIPALFWGEEARGDAPGGDADHRGPDGPALERLTEPSWWQGRPPLLEVLAAVYTAVADRAGAALRALVPPPPVPVPVEEVPLPPAAVPEPERVAVAAAALPVARARPLPLMLPGLEEAMRTSGGRRR